MLLPILNRLKTKFYYYRRCRTLNIANTKLLKKVLKLVSSETPDSITSHLGTTISTWLREDLVVKRTSTIHGSITEIILVGVTIFEYTDTLITHNTIATTISDDLLAKALKVL